MTSPASSADPEALWLAAYARGEPRAAEVLSRTLGPRAFAQALRMLGDRAEAEDVAQEALLRLWRIAPDWEPGRARVSTWLYRVVGNLCIDRLRRRDRLRPLEAAGEPASPAPGPAAGLQDSARRTALRAALAELPERQAQAVALRHLEGLGNAEIGAIMDISAEAVESLTARGKRALARALAPRRQDLGWSDD